MGHEKPMLEAICSVYLLVQLDAVLVVCALCIENHIFYI